MVHVDALSRQPTSECSAIQVEEIGFLAKMREAQAEDPHLLRVF